MKFNLPPYVLEIITTFQKSNFEIYIVGGAVRDLLMGREVHDWDFTTNATPEEILKLFPHAFYDNVFGTVGLPAEALAKAGIDTKHLEGGDLPKAHLRGGALLEITTYRSEEGYTDRRRPDKVLWGKTLEEDLARRDFTINALALNIESGIENSESKFTIQNSQFNLIDLFNGQKDLKAKIVRTVGDPVARFNEDALRMMRAVRIASELGFTIEEATFRAIKTNAPFINHVSRERIGDELLKLMASPYPYEGIVIFRNSGLLEQILPEVEKGFGVEQKSPKRHHVLDVGTHLFYSLRYCPSKDPVVRLAALLHDIGKPQTFAKDEKTGVITFYNHEVVGAHIVKNIAERLRLPNKDKDRLFKLVRWHLFSVDERQTDSALRRFIRNVGRENLEDILAVRTGDRLGGGAKETSWRFELFKKRLAEVQKQPFSVTDLKINGNDVMQQLGIPSGPMVGQILNQLFSEIEEGKFKNKKEDLIKRLKELS